MEKKWYKRWYILIFIPVVALFGYGFDLIKEKK